MSQGLTDLPPNNVDLERVVLQIILTRETNRQMYLTHLAPEHFYDLRHRAVFELARELHDRESALDSGMVSTVLAQEQKRGQLCGGLPYLWDILDTGNFGSPFNARIHIRDLRSLAKTRRDQEIGWILASGQIGVDERPALLDELALPTWSGEEADDSSIYAVAQRTITNYEAKEALAKSGRRFAGLDCGFDNLNEHLNGLCPGELTILAARPSVGKSTLALQIALAVAQDEQAQVGIISLEMTDEQIGDRLGCLLSGVNPHLQRRGRLNPDDRDTFYSGVADLSGLPVHLFLKDRDLAAMRARITQMPEVALWIVDHLHRVEGGQGENEHQRLGNIAEVMANLAVTMKRHILLLSQLNRECEKRPDKIPQGGDLRGSGSIEEHAVNVLMIYRPGHYKELVARVKDDAGAVQDVLHTATLFADKCRHEGPGTIELRWVPDRACFANPAPEYRNGQEPHDHWNN